ncbi:MAG: ABC transporter ATP-binding protein [Actinomycetota bacterium]
MAEVDLDGVGVSINRTAVLRDVTAHVGGGQFAAVVGPSGSGKSTLLRAIAGLVPIRTGVVSIGGDDMAGTTANHRDIAMVFQNPALLPNRNVRRNVAFPLELRHEAVEEIRQRVDAEARAMRIEGLLLKQPDELSQGEEQLVQIARALVRVPRVLLLDEPFASLDPGLTVHMRREIGTLQAGYGVTTVMATNDPDDAMTLADWLIVVERGSVVQSGVPGDVWLAPATLGAATSTGPLAVIEVTVARRDQGLVLTAGAVSGDPSTRFEHGVAAPTFADRVDDRMILGVRPAHAVLDARGAVRAVVDRVIPGQPLTVWCRCGGQALTAMLEPGVAPPERGDTVGVRIDHAVVFDRLTELAVT